MPRLVGINHVALEVGDLEEALAFYGRIFEFEIVREPDFPHMAFLQMGDQFLNLTEGRTESPDAERHFGLVVDDRAAVLAAAREAGVDIFGGNSFRDPWGNHVQIVEYGDVQFTKTPGVLRAMGLAGLGKTDAALGELRAKGVEVAA